MHDFTDFRLAKFHEICTQDVVLRDGESYQNQIFKIFVQGVVFIQKRTILYPRERLQTVITP